MCCCCSCTELWSSLTGPVSSSSGVFSAESRSVTFPAAGSERVQRVLGSDDPHRRLSPVGELNGASRAAARRCGPWMECDRSRDHKRSKTGVCACKTNYQVCGSDGTTYRSGCALRSANMAARRRGREPISVQNKGRCASAPSIVTPPGQVFNLSGSQVFLSCEAVGVPTPVLTWKKVLGGRKRAELLPGDRDNLAVQTRGGPEKHQVTGWVLISPLTEEEEGSYECHAANSRGEASAIGGVHLVRSVDDIILNSGNQNSDVVVY
uniref:Ig-like domain-containing protein n=1 Tax=Xiphophorus couchianus TaxID=32473 RepID=A0A3B5M5N1_9TELE